MQRFTAFFALTVSGFFVLVLTGCGNPDGRYTKVEGTITYNQQPVEGASVTFAPVNGGEGTEPAAGTTDENGHFVLTSSKAVKGGSGVLPGEYTVLVSKLFTPVDPDYEAFTQKKISFDEYQARLGRKDPNRRESSKHLLPEKYSLRDKTDLKVKVEPRKNSPFQFDLTD